MATPYRRYESEQRRDYSYRALMAARQKKIDKRGERAYSFDLKLPHELGLTDD